MLDGDSIALLQVAAEFKELVGGADRRVGPAALATVRRAIVAVGASGKPLDHNRAPPRFHAPATGLPLERGTWLVTPSIVEIFALGVEGSCAPIARFRKKPKLTSISSSEGQHTAVGMRLTNNSG